MPNAYIEKLVKQGKGSKATLEKKWEDAKDAAAKQGQGENYAYIMSVFQKMAKVESQAQATGAAIDDLDNVVLDVPLFIRLLELARETLKTDVELHDVVENVLALSTEKDVLTMDDYPNIWDESSTVEKTPSKEYSKRALSRFNQLARLGAKMGQETAADKSEALRGLATDTFGAKTKFDPTTGIGAFSGQKVVWVKPDTPPSQLRIRNFAEAAQRLGNIDEAVWDGDTRSLKVTFK